MNFQDFETVDGVKLIDLQDNRCWLISGSDIVERRVHHIDVWNRKYAIVDPNGNGYFTAQNPETCLYADPKNALRQAIANAQQTCAHAVEFSAKRLAEFGGAA